MFKHKKGKDDAEGLQHFFDDAFREELRQKGRVYFEKVIDDDATLFKKDLDALVEEVKSDLQGHVTSQLNITITQLSDAITKQLDDKLAEFNRTMKEAQDEALGKLAEREKLLEEQHKDLVAALEKTVAGHESEFVGAYKENAARIAQMDEAQGLAIKMLGNSTQALERQYQQLDAILQKSLSHQEAMLTSVFEKNMASVIEHYLMEALGDQLDLKAQLPGIVKQMEENRQAMVDDIKL